MHRHLRIAVVAVLLFVVSAAVPAAEKYALLIGVAKYEHAEMNRPQPLEFPEADAAALGDVLKASGYEVVQVVGKEATKERIRAELGKLKKQGSDMGVVLIGFFGHGVEYETTVGKQSTVESYFCPFDVELRIATDANGRPLKSDDGKRDLIEPDPTSALGMTEVFTAMRLSKAGRRILLADCCRNDPNAARGRSFGANVNTGDLPERTAALFACSSGEKAYEDQRSRHGIFTSALIDRIRSHSEGALTAGALGEYLEEEVPKRVNKLTNGRAKQTPRYLSISRVDLQLQNGVRPEHMPGISQFAIDGEKLWLEERLITLAETEDTDAMLELLDMYLTKKPSDFKLMCTINKARVLARKSKYAEQLASFLTELYKRADQEDPELVLQVANAMLASNNAAELLEATAKWPPELKAAIRKACESEKVLAVDRIANIVAAKAQLITGDRAKAAKTLRGFAETLTDPKEEQSKLQILIIAADFAGPR